MVAQVLLNLDEHIETVRESAEKLAAHFVPPVSESLAFLRSQEALAMIERDPYWPKWNNPWWHALLLCELDCSALISREFFRHYSSKVNKHYLHFFPFTLEAVPVGRNPRSVVACHCYLGSFFKMHQLVKPDYPPLEWIVPWFKRYQNEDGGLNCDEEKYLKPSPTSSFLSTVACLEGMLTFEKGILAEDEDALDFLDRGVTYLLERKLLRSKRTGEIIDEKWLQPAFPRFYSYDILRGLSLVTSWALKRGRKLSRQLIEEALELVAQQVGEAGLVPRRSHVAEMKTLLPLPNGEFEEDVSAGRFSLLDFVDRVGEPSLPLTQEWLGLLLRLKYMSDARLLSN
jgi:hypothetical protein